MPQQSDCFFTAIYWLRGGYGIRSKAGILGSNSPFLIVL